MTPQEIFDKALAGVVAQGRRSAHANRVSACAYRGTNGCKCAVGHLIPDELAKQWDARADTSIRSIAETDGLPLELDEHLDLLEQLQMVHDNVPENGSSDEFVRAFCAGMKGLAQEHGLKFNDPLAMA